MAENDIKPTVFFLQLFEVAPAIAQLLKTYTARIRASITSHDVVNGYGFGMTYHVFIEVFGKRCPHCLEDDFSEPRFDCRWHKFEPIWILIADGEGKDSIDALGSINDRVAHWLKMRGAEVGRAI